MMEDVLRYASKPTTAAYPEPAEFNPQYDTLFFLGPF
jgi:hypothetical protein